MLSVICPIYNEEKYIAQFLDSLLQQDYPKDDLEILLVDGMSKDRTREIVAGYTAKYSFIRLIDNPDKIVPYAMNNRIVIKDGAYIGMRASIIAPKGDVEIGEKAIVGTMTLVNKSIPAGMTAVGVPCRILEKRVLGPDVQDIDKDNGNV